MQRAGKEKAECRSDQGIRASASYTNWEKTVEHFQQKRNRTIAIQSRRDSPGLDRENLQNGGDRGDKAAEDEGRKAERERRIGLAGDNFDRSPWAKGQDDPESGWKGETGAGHLPRSQCHLRNGTCSLRFAL